MAGAAIKVDFQTRALKRYVENLAKLNKHKLLDAVGALIASQTEYRINSEKKAPDGTPWQPRKNKKLTHPLLELTSRLLGSIQYQVHGNKVIVGSNVEYAATQQYGDKRRITTTVTWKGEGKVKVKINRNIPARPYLGLSRANNKAIRGLIAEYIAQG